MARFFSLILLTIGMLACKKGDTTPTPAPTASFSFSLATSGEVAFMNSSQNATSYSWDFGDNSVKVTDTNPRHVYAVNGKYNVILTATGEGGSATSTQVVTVTNAPDPKLTADFTATEVGGVVSFVSTTNYTTSVLWDFGDGTAKSTEANPKHTYTRNQTYTVTLTATGKGGPITTSKSVTVKAAPVVDPKVIYISKITLTQLGYYPKNQGTYRIFVNRKDNAGYVELFKSTDSYPLFEIDKRYEFTEGLPFKLNYPDRVHTLKLADNSLGYYATFGDSQESIVYFDGEQPLLAYLRKKGFPTKVTINDATSYSYKATFEVEFTYEY